MKLLINLSIFIIVLLIPFALSSQTRKAIPAGRYEALSGVKISRSKNEITSLNNSQNSFWQEVSRNLPSDRSEFYYVKKTSHEFNFSNLIANKSMRELKSQNQKIDLMITEDLKSDKEVLKQLSSKGLIILISTTSLKDVLTQLSSYNLIIYQAFNSENFYLLKLK